MSTTGNQSNLSAAKQALLSKLLDSKSSSPVKSQTIAKRPQQNTSPLSFGQQRVWSHEQMELELPLYNVVTPVRLHGPLAVTALEQSLNELVERHESLRSTFTVQNDLPVAHIAAAQPLTLSLHDLSVHSQAERETAALQHVRQEANHPFDISRGPLFRAMLIRMNEQEHILVLNVHHIVTDGWSTGVLLKELTALYEAFATEQPSPLPISELQYGDFAHWQHQHVGGDVLEDQLSYWKKQLTGQPELLPLPTDHQRPAKMSFRGKSHRFELPPSLTVRLKGLAKQSGATLFMTLLAAYKTLLYRHSNQSDISVGTPIAGRTRPEFENMIGFFVNSLVLRSDLSGNPAFREVLAQERNVALEAFSHQEVPFDKLLEELQVPRDASYTPLFQVLFALQTPPAHLQMNGVLLELLEQKNEASKHDLSLYMYEESGVLRGLFEYSADLFDPSTIERLSEHWHKLLESIAANPDERIDLLSMLSTAETQQLLVEWNDTAVEYPQDKCVHHLFEAQAARTPDAVAVEFAHTSLTYRELNERANQVAHYLRNHGVQPETLVGIFIERSVEMVVGLLGILKSGGAYVPLDPSYPQDRLAFMLEDAKLPLLLTQQHLAAKLPSHGAQVICLDSEWADIAAERSENATDGSSPDNLAYIIYTSGSTGRPKGAMIIHRGLTNYLSWAVQAYELQTGSGTLVHSPVGFDLTITGLFPPLLAGAKVVLLSESTDAEALSQALRTHENFSLVKLTPAHMLLLTQQIPAEELAGRTRMLVIGGEALTAEHIAPWQQFAPNTTLINEYGPTETVVGCCVYKVPARVSVRGQVSIGRPIANTKMYLLNPAQQPVPIGVPGEIYIGGHGVARGYLNRPDLTQEKFIPDPFSSDPNGFLYRTGDEARYLPDGRIEFLGRLDDQVKIRGFRIELGEIESVLVDHPNVRETLVLAREDQPGDKRLVAYLVAAPGQELAVESLREFLQARLPEYMVPSAFVSLDAFPLTTNGKIDRRALPEPDGARPHLGNTFEAPRNEVEAKLAAIWSAILQIEQVGLYDNFHTLGGHSLMAIMILSRIREAFGVMLPFTALFDAPTVAGLSERIATELGDVAKTDTTDESQVHSIPNVSRDLELPISIAQQRLWFLDLLEPNSAAYNIPFAIRLKGTLEVAVLEQTLTEITRRHEALRTTFADHDSHVLQKIAPVRSMLLPLTDLSHLGADEREQQALEQFRTEGLTPFTLSVGPLFRVQLVRLQEQEHILILNMHHIISDGWSLRIFNQELTALYEAFLLGKPSPLPELSIQYADFAHWQRQHLQREVLDEQLAYWKQQLGGDLPVLQLPTDFRRPEQKDTTGAHESLSLPSGLTKKLKQLSQQEGATLFMTVTAVFKLLLSRHSGQEDILIGTPTANRNRSEIEGLIGFFLNTLVIRTDMSGNPTFKELVTRVREAALGAFSHAELPFEKLVEELQPERNLSGNPLFNVMVNPGVYDAKRQTEWTLPGLTLSPIALNNPDAIFPLELYIDEQEQEINLHLLYQSALYSNERIYLLLDQFRMLLEQVAADPNLPIHAYSLLTDRTRALLPDPTEVLPEPNHSFVASRIADWAEYTPESVAISQGERTWTYRELHLRATELASMLLVNGVERGEVVAVLGTRNFGMIAAMLGILKSGGVLLTIDQNLPHQRQKMMIEQAGATRLLLASDIALEQELHVQLDLVVTEVDPLTAMTRLTEEKSLTSAPCTLPQLAPDDAAYLFFTSGTTGVPKGVLGVHKGLNHFLHWQSKHFAITPNDRFAQLTNLSFDVVLRDIFLPLTSGAILCLPEVLDDLSSETVLPWLEREGITGMHTVPSLVHSWLTSPHSGVTLRTMRYVFSAGEPLTDVLVRRLRTTFPAMGQIVNLYGPTETTLAKCFYLVPDELLPGIQPIGELLPQTQALILSEHGELCGIGEAGEIVLRTPFRTRGYVNVGDEQNKQWISNPFRDDVHDVMYRTGDRGRYRPDGLLEILGRTDDQVKIRGVRIQLNEIAATLATHPAVESCAVLDFINERGEYFLAAYAVIAPQHEVSKTELRRYLSNQLPAAMVPAAVVLIDRLPLTPNGKIDRKALPAPEITFAEETYVAPRNETEEQIAAIWRDVLGIDRIGVENNFFEAGGHSLLATLILSRVRKTLAVEVPMRLLFEQPTIAALAQAVDERKAKQAGSGNTAPLSIVPTSGDQLLSNLDDLSDEEVAIMLAQLMNQEDK